MVQVESGSLRELAEVQDRVETGQELLAQGVDLPQVAEEAFQQFAGGIFQPDFAQADDLGEGGAQVMADAASQFVRAGRQGRRVQHVADHRQQALGRRPDLALVAQERLVAAVDGIAHQHGAQVEQGTGGRQQLLPLIGQPDLPGAVRRTARRVNGGQHRFMAHPWILPSSSF